MLATNYLDTSAVELPLRSSQYEISALDYQRVRNARQGYVCRRVPRNQIATILEQCSEPLAGDAVLVRVKKIGRFDFIESSDFTMHSLKVGQELIACYAPVHGTNDAVGVIPSKGHDFQLLNPAGIVSRVTSRSYLAGNATELELLGILADSRGGRLTLADWTVPVGIGNYVSQPVIAVIGERNLPGETCRSADIIRGLAQAGFSVGAANITGVPGCWKVRMLRNSGARLAVDITDAGYVGTAGVGVHDLERIFLSLSSHLSDSGVDIIVLEMEQGVFGHDTAAIISTPSFQNRISTIVLEGKAGQEAELERDSLRALGYDVTLVDTPENRRQYQVLI